MGSKAKNKKSQIIIKNGKPSAVIIDIADYEEMLERLEDVDDLKMLRDMRKKPLCFKKLDEFINVT